MVRATAFQEGKFVMDAIPVIDVSGLTSEDVADRRKVAAQLGHACRGIGFFYVANHGIPATSREATFAAAHTFFGWPLETKEEFLFKGDRGFVAVEKEALDERAGHSDYKEALGIGLDLAADDPEVLAGKPFRGVNMWPTVPGWRETVLDYYDRCLALGRLIHRGFALDLDLQENFFEDKLDAPLATLRMLHYPLQPAGRPRTPDSGAGEHTDYGNLTVLATDGVAGLQVRTRNGDWVDAPYIPDTFICNIGDCLMRWTNDVYVSTPHRVGTPVRDRYSLAFFLDPNPDARVEVLAKCLAPGAYPKYPPISGADYLRERLDASRTA